MRARYRGHGRRRAAFFLALAFGLDELVFERRARPLRIAAGFACAATLVALPWLAHAQIFVWQDSETLWRHAIDVTRDNYVAHANLGRALQATHPAEAQVQFGAALAINPDAFQPVASRNDLPGARSDPTLPARALLTRAPPVR